MPKSLSHQLTHSTLRTGDEAMRAVFRWAVTDRTGLNRSLSNMPEMGFLDTLKYLFSHLLVSLAGAVLGGLWIYVLVAYGIPFLIQHLTGSV